MQCFLFPASPISDVNVILLITNKLNQKNAKKLQHIKHLNPKNVVTFSKYLRTDVYRAWNVAINLLLLQNNKILIFSSEKLES